MFGLAMLSTLLVLGLLYWFPIRRWFGLYPIDEGRIRLVSRNRASVPSTVGSAVFMCVLEPAAFIMTRKMLLGLKRRAEALAAEKHDAARHAA